MKSLSAILLALLFVAGPLWVNAQQYPVKRYTMRDGLLHSIVYSTYQDRQGFIWFCTNRGLSRFDGKNFKNYTQKDGLSNTAVLSMSENEAGQKLLSVYRSGIDIMTGDKITPMKTKGKPGKWVIRNIPAKGNALWVLAKENEKQLQLIKDGIVRLAYGNVNWKNVFLNEGYNFKGDILFATTNGIYRVINDTAIQPYLYEITRGRDVTNIAWKQGNEYWISVDRELIHYKNGVITEKYQLNFMVSDLLWDNDNNVWVALDNGELFLVRENVMNNFTDKLPIPKVIITDLLQDREGNIWFTTQGLGVFCLTSLNIKEYPAKTGELNNYANCLEQTPDGAIWIGSFGTISMWKDGQIRQIASGLSPSEFIYFIKLIGNKLYIGTPDKLLCKEMVYPYKETQVSGPLGAISICANSKNEIFFGSFNNIYAVKGNTVTKLDSTGALSGSRCNACVFDKYDALWVATDSGVVKYYNGRFTYPAIENLKRPFKVNALFVDSDKRLWIATDSGLYYEHDNAFKSLTTQNGLTHNTCKELFEEKNKTLWIGTENGINVLDLKNHSIKEFIPGVVLSEITAILKRDQDLFISTIDGLTVIDASKIERPESVPPLYITSVTTNDGEHFMPSSLVVSYKNNKLSVGFSGLSYRYPDRTEYRYRMQGLDNNWHYTKNNMIEFSGLPGGNYSFEVEVRSGKSEWGNRRVLKVEVLKPYWATWWFILLAVVILLPASYLLLRRLLLEKEKAKRKKLLALNKIAYLKQQALSALINPHFIFNCMNSIQNYLNKKDHDQANKYLSDFAKLIRMTIEHAQESFISLEKEIERINLYFILEKLRFGNKLSYKIEIDPDLMPVEIRIPNMILQPFVENAIWHGIMPKKGGNVHLSFGRKGDRQLCIVVKDDGVGINKQKKAAHKSLGIGLINNRLKLLSDLLNENYSCTINVIEKGGVVMGTEVTIILPLKPTEQDLLNLEQIVHSIEDN